MNKRQIISAIGLCLYLAAVAFLCFAKPDELPQVPMTWFGLPADKVGHFIMFLPFPFLSYMVFGNKDRKFISHVWLMLLIICLGIGLAIGTEQIQAQLAYRDAEFMDLYADGAGLAVGTLMTVLYIIKMKK